MTDCVNDDRYSTYRFQVILELNTHRRLYPAGPVGFAASR
jgi:hypothetical protein